MLAYYIFQKYYYYLRPADVLEIELFVFFDFCDFVADRITILNLASLAGARTWYNISLSVLLSIIIAP